MAKAQDVLRMIGDRNRTDIISRGDAYRTPPEAVYPLFNIGLFTLSTKYWECACGDGAISKLLCDKYGEDKVVSTDLYDWGYGKSGVDYLTAPVPDGVSTIITNPPYSLFNEFLEKAYMDISKGVDQVWFLAPLRYLASIRRKKFFQQPSFFFCLYVFSRRLPRPHAFEYDGKKSSSMIDFGWFVFARNFDTPEIRFIDWKDFAKD